MLSSLLSFPFFFQPPASLTTSHVPGHVPAPLLDVHVLLHLSLEWFPLLYHVRGHKVHHFIGVLLDESNAERAHAMVLVRVKGFHHC